MPRRHREPTEGERFVADAIRKCCSWGVSFVLTLILVIVFLTGGNPKLRLSSVSLETLKRIDSSDSLILVFNAEFKLKNNNFLEASLDSTKAAILFSGAEIGTVPINEVSVGKRSTEKFNMTVYVDSDKISVTDSLRREMVTSRNLTLVAFAKYTTEANWVFKKSSKMNCSFVLDTVSKKIVPPQCK